MSCLSRQWLPRVFSGVLLALTAACQSLPVPPEILNSPGLSRAAESPSYQEYRSDRLDLSFAYPNNLTIEEKGNAIQIWSAADYRDIQAGKYNEATELPPNITILIYPNPEELPLRKWLKASGQEHFGLLEEDLRETLLRDYKSLSFSSKSLYPKKNALFALPESRRIVALSKAEVPGQSGDSEKAIVYQQAFEQIVATLSLDS